MKEYFYLVGKDRNGPLTIEEIVKKNLSDETFIWTEGMDNWKKLKDIPELLNKFNFKIPPSIPEEVLEEFDDSPIKYNRLEPIERKKIKINSTTIFILWSSFHLFALLMSYTRIDFFNHSGEPKIDKFWPFVSFSDYYCIENHGFLCFCKNDQKQYEFHGVFVQYDWTEFAFYIGLGIILFLLLKTFKKANK
jgi:hypothetical protein